MSNKYQIRYDVDTKLTCEAKPKNSNIKFTSWSGDLLSDSNSNPIIDNPTITFRPYKYGNLTANFIQAPPPVQISPEALVGLYSIVVTAIIGWFVPGIASWINSKRQGKYLDEYMTYIFEAYDKLRDNKDKYLQRLETIKRQVAEKFAKGKLSESQYEILNDKISDYENEATNP